MTAHRYLIGKDKLSDLAPGFDLCRHPGDAASFIVGQLDCEFSPIIDIDDDTIASLDHALIGSVFHAHTMVTMLKMNRVLSL